MWKNVLVPMLFLFVTASTHASKINVNTGNYWYEVCTETSITSKASCASFFMGTIRGAQAQASLTESEQLFCLPDDASYGQAKDVVIKYLKDHPEYRHDNVMMSTFVALGAAFPCAK